jgi:ribosomal protein L11 methyltransferase
VSWRALRITPSADADTLIALLFASGAQAVQEDGSDIVTHFPPDTDIAEIQRRIRDADSSAGISIAESPDITPATLHGTVGIQKLGRITIAPVWMSASIDDAGLVLIDPASAFGTGEHATTRGAIRLMQKIDIRGAVVADLGAGSAVLSIAATKLGAGRVVAIENDPQAIGNAEENVRGNMAGNVVTLVEGEAAVILPLIAPVGVVLANIISSVLIELLDRIHASLIGRGYAIFSGILTSEKDQFLGEAGKRGFSLVDEDIEGEWWSGLLERR